MKPTEFETVEGQTRWRILRAMFQALASQAHWIGVLSNWALGTTGVYIGLVVTNFDKMSGYLPAGFQTPVFRFALASAVVGIGIQFLWGLVQFSLNVENQLLAVMLPEVTKPGADADLVHRILDPVLEEFINSRPPLFRQLARCSKKKGEKDLVVVTKSAATIAQVMFALLFIQYILLAVAIFWPLSVITTTPNRPAIDFPHGSLATTPAPIFPSQTPTSKPTLSPKPTTTPSATPAK